jgi:hypothetical protein
MDWYSDPSLAWVFANDRALWNKNEDTKMSLIHPIEGL